MRSAIRDLEAKLVTENVGAVSISLDPAQVVGESLNNVANHLASLSLRSNHSTTMTQPTLNSERLIVRPFAVDDAPSVQQLAGDRAIADTTVNVPHPYEDGMAETWIGSHKDSYKEGKSARFALVDKASDALIGAMGLEIDNRSRQAELGYWIAVPFWNQGYATEAAAEVVRYGFEKLGLDRIGASHFTRNPASGRVMQKIGMTHEGTTRQGAKRWDTFEDLERYGLLHSDWLDRQV